MRGGPARIDTSSMIAPHTECPNCGSDALIEHAVHDGMGWVHQLECERCRHVLESISYLSQESAWIST
jgi:predicted  nucleic acid-binding Zn ribbon protein